MQSNSGKAVARSLLVALIFFVLDHDRRMIGLSNTAVAPTSWRKTRKIVPMFTFNMTELNFVLPMAFSLPDGRYDTARKVLRLLQSGQPLAKNRTFATIVPGDKSTYIYKTEKSYYEGYSTSLFGITMRKAGWDCFRHYEILAAGAVPFFVGLDQLPPLIMHNFPRDLVLRAMSLPGVPPQEQVQAAMKLGTVSLLSVDESIFDRNQYNQILQELIEYSIQQLTWSTGAEYFLSSLRQLYPCAVGKHPRVLFVSSPHDCEYTSCVVYGGLHMALGSDMSSLNGPKDVLFANFTRGRLYGGGMSYTNVFPELNEPLLLQREITEQRLQEGFFDIIVWTNAGNAKCCATCYDVLSYGNTTISGRLKAYQQAFNPLFVVVDGSDGGGCHIFFQDGSLKYHVQFSREYGNFRRGRPSPSRWESLSGKCAT